MSVYTELSFDQVAAIVKGYALGALHKVTGIAAGIENSNFFIDTDSGRFVLTIFERMDHTSVPWFMQLMHHLSHHGLACPDVQSQRNGKMVFALDGKAGCIVSCLPGRVHDLLSLRQLESAGVTLAKLHQAGHDFSPQRANSTGSSWLEETANQLVGKIAQRYGVATEQLLFEELAWQQQQPQQELPNGIIHGDYFCDNILFEGEEVSGVIDFYYAHTAPFVMDIAISINALSLIMQQEDEERMALFIAGYQQVRPLHKEELEALPALLRLAALRFWLSRLYDAIFPREGAMTQVKDPEEYRRKLQWHRRDGNEPSCVVSGSSSV
ncbi:MAG: homoserine kinase [Mariprofundales bacterium]